MTLPQFTAPRHVLVDLTFRTLLLVARHRIDGAIGEWTYYLLGSAIEIALLAAIAYYAWNWPIETADPHRTESLSG